MKLVYLSPVPWRSFAQRSHEMVRYFHALHGGEVLWIDPYPTRLLHVKDMVRIKLPALSESTALPEWLQLAQPKALPIEPFAGLSAINRLLWRDVVAQVCDFADQDTCFVAGKPSKLALQLMKSCNFRHTLYDAMDNFPAFYHGISARAMAHTERKLASNVSQLIVSSHHCKERMEKLGLQPKLVLNGCAASRLPDYAPRKRGERLTLGYVGTVGHWFDWKLVLQLAYANPYCHIRIIGPVFVPLPAQLPSNITLEPLLAHREALAVMQEFDAGLIPFVLSPLTDSVDPIKYYEYKALGLPVISSAFGEMRHRREEPGAFFVSAASDLSTIVHLSQQYAPDAADIASFRAEHDWQKRFADAMLFA